MKAGWEVKPLKDVIQKLETVDPRKAPDVPFRYIDVSSVSKKTLAVEEITEMLGSDAPSRARRRVRSGDTIFATIRPTLKRIAHIEPEHDQAICSTGYFVLRATECVDSRYIYYFLQSADFADAMKVLQKGASYPAVTDGEVKSQPIPLPPIDEQKRIVAVLDAAFEGLTRARARVETNLHQARELFESVLETAVFQDITQFGTIPLAELALEITDGDHSPPPKAANGIPFITISNIQKEARKIDFLDTFKVPESYFLALKDKRKPRKGDVLYTVTGATLGIPILVEDDRNFCFQRHIGLIRPSSGSNSTWLSYSLMSRFAFGQATAGASGAAQKTVSLRTLRGLLLPNTPLEKQNERAEIFQNVWLRTSEISFQYRAKLQDLDDLRQSLLQKAFAGELT